MKKFFSAIYRYFKITDKTLILFSIAASLFGLLLVYSASQFLANESGISTLFKTQIIAIALGLISMVILSKIDYHTVLDYWKIIAIAGVLILLITLIFGKGPELSEDRSWLRFGKFSVQPAEFVKLLFVLTFSKHYELVKDDVSSIKNVLLLFLHGAIPIGIIVLQKDMGMALVFAVVFVTMLFASNIKLRYFAGGAIILLGSFPLIWNKIFGDTQRNRILALFDPNNPAWKNSMWQQNRAVTALGSGKIWGYGFLNGPKTQAASNTALPERQNDMIFAVCGEELGFIGCIVLLAIITIILVRIIIDSTHSKDGMGSMICVGIFSSFAVQIVINLGMVLRVLPVCGLTLPFISSGGSSVLSAFLSIGMVLSVYMHRKDLMFAGQSDN